MYFDIGANIGKWSLTNIDNCDKIIAIEASPLTYSTLVNNCAKYSNIITLNFIVCNDKDEKKLFYHSFYDTLSTTNINWFIDITSRYYNVPYVKLECNTISIDNLISKYGMPDLIKIDVEGGEYDCISSLNHKVKLLCFEWTSEMKEIAYMCLDHLYTIGFRHFYVQYEDNYTFRPSILPNNIFIAKQILKFTRDKIDWGMIWCK